MSNTLFDPPGRVSLPILSPKPDKCSFLARVYEHTAELSDPEWRAALSIIQPSMSAHGVLNELGPKRPGFDLEGALRQPRSRSSLPEPVTCDAIANILGHAGCADCQYRKRVKSPAELDWTDTIDSPKGRVVYIGDREYGILNRSAPLGWARAFVHDQYLQGDDVVLAWFREAFWRFDGTAYVRVSDETLRRQVLTYLDGTATIPKQDADPVKFNPTARDVYELITHLKSVVLIEGEGELFWIRHEEGDPDPQNLVVFPNGVLDVVTRAFAEPNPRLFARSTRLFPYFPKPPFPERWVEFLNQNFAGDEQQISLLQEFFGYVLVGTPIHRKILVLTGPTASGKSLISNILRELVGVEDVADLFLDGFAGPFGLHSLIGQRLGIFDDVRQSRWMDEAIVVQRLLTISGNDRIPIARKYEVDWRGRLNIRLMMVSNEVPTLEEHSGALAGRLLLLETKISHLRRENLGLEDQLRTELPSIMMWALLGADRLRQQGRFTTPDSTVAALEEVTEASSPMQQFVRERCQLAPGVFTPTGQLFNAYLNWCQTNGLAPVKRRADFGRQLKAAFPMLTPAKDPLGKQRGYRGIQLGSGEPVLQPPGLTT